MTDAVDLALAQFPLGHFTTWDDLAASLTSWVEEGARQGRLLVFPEYGGMTLVGLCPQDTWADEVAQLPALQPWLPAYRDLHARLARAHGVYILAGSLPVEEGGRYFNRAYLFSPDGGVAHQDKLVLTPSEVRSSGLTPGAGARVFDTALGCVAVNICYDSEFPHQARAQAEAGAEVLLVPTCTSNARGYHRVRVSSMARALENQLGAAVSPLIGEAPWLAGLERSTGAAGAYTPSDEGLPEDGVLAQGQPDQPGWVSARLELERLRFARREGHVLNLRDEPAARQRVSGGVTHVTL